MAKTYDGQGWILHIKPFQDQKRLVDALIEDVGRVKLVLYKKKHEPLSILTRYQFSFYGNKELKTCQQYESLNTYQMLKGKSLFCALYINELLTRLLPIEEALDGLCYEYQKLLISLSKPETLEIVLRQFEFWLLERLGYACDWFTDAHSGACIESTKAYGFKADEGIYELDPMYATEGIPGENLMDIFEGTFELPKSLAYAKWLVREAYNPLLGDRPLMSRQLFMDAQKRL
jgi:DNA repair protein RecO (recombination protein O)